MHWGTLKQPQIIEKSAWQCYVKIFFPQFRTDITLFVSVICLVPAKLWNFLEVRMLYDKIIENLLWSYT